MSSERAGDAGRGAAMPGVGLEALAKRFGDVGAVDGLSLEVKPGELLALLGPSGCGKTTTLRLVAGFLTPEAGEIWVGDRCLSSPASVVAPERRRMAMIFQSYALWPHMTVAHNVAYGLRFKRGLARADREHRVREMLRVVQPAGYEARYPGELSGGQQQRLAVAPAPVGEPAWRPARGPPSPSARTTSGWRRPAARAPPPATTRSRGRSRARASWARAWTTRSSFPAGSRCAWRRRPGDACWWEPRSS